MLKNKKYFNAFGVFFILFSGSFYFLIIVNKQHYFGFIIIIILGLFLYSGRLYLDGIKSIKEINFKVLLYYIIAYIKYLIIFIIFFGLVFSFFKNNPNLFFSIFVDEDQFLRHAKRGVLVLSGLFVSTSEVNIITGSTHLGSKFSKQIGTFTPKIDLTHSVFISISIFLGVLSGFFFVSFFIVVISFSTLPEFIKKKIQKEEMSPSMSEQLLINQKELNAIILKKNKEYSGYGSNLKQKNYLGGILKGGFSLLINCCIIILICFLYASVCVIIDCLFTYFIINKYNPFL